MLIWYLEDDMYKCFIFCLLQASSLLFASCSFMMNRIYAVSQFYQATMTLYCYSPEFSVQYILNQYYIAFNLLKHSYSQTSCLKNIVQNVSHFAFQVTVKDNGFLNQLQGSKVICSYSTCLFLVCFISGFLKSRRDRKNKEKKVKKKKDADSSSNKEEKSDK